MAIDTRIERMKLQDLKLLPSSKNARFMRPEQFQRLVQNIQTDGSLTSVPLAWKDEDGRYLVLSGNHRVMAAIEAGIETADVMLTDDPLPLAKRHAIQLSHNAIAGEDDLGILKELWAEIDDVESKLYSGLDDKTLELLEDPGLPPLVEVDMDFKTVSFLFLPEERDKLMEVIDRAAKSAPTKDRLGAAASQYDPFMSSLRDVADAHGVRNAATILSLFIDWADQQLELLLGEDDEP